VLPGRDLAPRPETGWLSPALAEILGRELGRDEVLRLARGDQVAQTVADLGLAGDAPIAPALGRLRLSLAADLVVSSSYEVKPRAGQRARLRVALELWDAAAGGRLASLTEEGDDDHLLDILSRAGARLRRELSLQPAPPEQGPPAFPTNPEAARAYAEGLQQMRALDPAGARASLSRAAALEPQSAYVHAALADVLRHLGFVEQARVAAQRAFELSAPLGRSERLWFEGLYRELQRNWDRAIEIERALFTFFPDDVDYGLRLASAQVAANKSKDALATLQKLHQLPPPSGDDPRIDSTEAEADATVSDFEASLSAARRAYTKGATRGARLIVARGKSSEGQALLNLGRPDEAVAALREALGTFRAAGDASGEVRVLQRLGFVHADGGDLEGARREFGEALGISQRRANQLEIAALTDNLGVLLHRMRDLAGARRKYEESLAVKQRFSAPRMEAITLGNIAIVCMDQGDLEGALSNIERGLAKAREVGLKHAVAQELAIASRIRLQRGELGRARELAQESVAIEKEIHSRKGPARDALARVLLAQGNPREAERAARESLQAQLQAKAKDDAVGAALLLSRALLSQGRPDDARRVFDSLPADGRLNPTSQQALVFARALVDGLSGVRVEGAVQDLRAVLAEQLQSGYLADAFETRLALGEIEVKRGQLRAGRSDLKALAADARARGFVTMALEAERSAR
jgi:tetratricopeptide (TPR) repeat protein